MKKIILYVTGGLSNRIFPLVSCMQYAKETNRELYVYWPIDRVVPTEFNNLYNVNINFVNKSFLNNLDDSKTEYHSNFIDAVYNDYNIYNRHFLINKHKEGKIQIGLYFGNSENIFLITNTFLNIIPEHKNKSLLQGLKLHDKDIKTIEYYTNHLKLNKNVLGAHIRGTDLNKGLDYYVNHIKKLLEKNKKIFICSEEKELELSIYNLFPEQIIYRKNKKYVTKYNPEQTTWNGWGNNTYMKDIHTMTDAIYDLYLLAKTDLQFYNINSTYSSYAKILSEVT